MDIALVKFLHILSSTFLFGTGVGTAFYLLFASRQRDPVVVAAVARLVVIADWLFTATTIVVQPLTGLYLAHRLHIPLSTPWLYWSIVLFVIAGLCWLPVVGIQIRLRDIAQQAAASGQPLPAAYDRHLGTWAAMGVPALFSFLAIFYLMTAKPAL
ncbi:DUF2269 domain-containing protein [Luteimonas sp. RC10]|uniref:DUF2269 family protein n=1 Tax=Luteimonas sp. RC10 TaxID=2587035 RepID=UPI001622BD99|nr:DUF2269 domain-containing protein [Luteimonas sp. RC10]MBB3345035.1 putative membrane protein [Luteimonas sp. RC10]